MKSSTPRSTGLIVVQALLAAILCVSSAAVTSQGADHPLDDAVRGNDRVFVQPDTGNQSPDSSHPPALPSVNNAGSAASQPPSAFSQLFGGADTQPAVPSPTQTSDKYDFTGFKEPPGVMSLRSNGQTGDGQGEGIISWWFDAPAGTISTGRQFDIGPWGDYGTVDKAMAWDTDGYLSGGWAHTTRKKERIADYTLFIEKFDLQLGIWKPLSQQKSPNGAALNFTKEGFYRLSVLPHNTVFRVAPKYKVVTVEDPTGGRTGSIIYAAISGKGPDKTVGGISISGQFKESRDSGPGGTFQKDCGDAYRVSALVRRARVKSDSLTSMVLEELDGFGKYEPYKQAHYLLRDQQDGTVLQESNRGDGDFGDFIFNANKWRDGSYTLEIHLAPEHQGNGITQMPVKHHDFFISVYGCGQGERKKKIEPPERSFKEAEPKKEEVAFNPPAFAELDGNNMKKVPQVKPHELLDPQTPNGTPPVPIRISDDCEEMRAQIVHRNKQLQVPCDYPVTLMEQSLAAPKRHEDLLKDYTREWDAALAKLQQARAPFMKLYGEYTVLLKEAIKLNLTVSTEDQEKYRPMDANGNPSVIGRGIPVGFFVFEPVQISAADRLRDQQKKIYEEWAAARRNAEKIYAELKQSIEPSNQRFSDFDQALLDLRTDLQRMQGRLAGLYFSGSHEHCLGGGGVQTSGDYTIKQADGTVQSNKSVGLPGMAVQLPDPPRKRITDEGLEVPKPLHELIPLKLKQDGRKQLLADRKLLESLAEAERLKYEAENGTWLNWVGSRMEWLGEGAMGLAGAAAGTTGIPALTEMMGALIAGKSMDDALKAANEKYSQDTAWVGAAGQGVYNALAVKPAHEVTKSVGDFLWGMTESLVTAPGQAAADYLHMRNEVLPELEKIQEELANFKLKPGEDPVADNRRLELLQRQTELWGKMEKGVAGMDQMILLVATSSTILKGVNATAAQLEQASAKLGQFLQQGRAAAQLTGDAVKGKAVLESTLQHLDEVGDAGVAGSQLTKQGKQAIVAANKIDDLIKAQQEALKEGQKILDDALRKAQENAAKLDSPKNWQPMKDRIDLPGDKLQNAPELGRGTMGAVKDLGDGKVIKTFQGLDAQQKLVSEVEGLKIMREANIPHVKADGVAVSTIVKDGKQVQVSGIVKDKFSANQLTVEQLLEQQGGRLTRQQQIEALEYYNQAAKKGVVFADPNPGNLIREMMPDGSTRFLAVEGGGVVKTDPVTAKKLMDLMLTDDLDGAIQFKDFHPNMFVEKAGALIGETKAQDVLKFGGASFKDVNIAKAVDPEILAAFKDPKKWEQLVDYTNKQKALVQLDDATKARYTQIRDQILADNKQLQQAAQQQAANINQAQQQLNQAAEQSAQKAAEAARKLETPAAPSPKPANGSPKDIKQPDLDDFFDGLSPFSPISFLSPPLHRLSEPAVAWADNRFIIMQKEGRA